VCWRPAASHCNTLQLAATRCNTQQHAATAQTTRVPTSAHCPCIMCDVTLCIALQRTATHCNTLQHTSTRCNILQHTATAPTARESTSTWQRHTRCSSPPRQLSPHFLSFRYENIPSLHTKQKIIKEETCRCSSPLRLLSKRFEVGR